MADAVVKRDSSDDGLRPRLNPDIYRHLLSILHTTEVLTCACVCTALRQLCESALRVSPLCCVRGSPISGAKLLWLLKERLHGECVRLDVSGCANLTKVQGGEAIAALLLTTRLKCLSMRFTGVGDATCAALATGLGDATCRLGDATGDARGRGGCALRSLHLAGNRISSAGATRLAGSLGRLTLLDMTANLELTPEAAVAIASALPSSRLQCLRLAGCKVDKRGCSRLAATLMLSPLASLDLSANHFGSEGSDELAWVLADCTALTALNLADCDLDDDAADELLEALGGGDDADAQPPPLRALDLRWNKLSAPRHQGGRGISADARVDSSSQKEMSAADRQTAHLEQTWQQAKASGKKIYVPKWQREQKEREVGKRSGSTGSAIA